MARPLGTPDAMVRSAPPLAGDAHLPLYRRLYQTFAQRIAAGEWKPGDGLPSETDLAKHYHMAPGTVRRALDDLSGNGLVERKHGHGTFVRRPNFDNAMLRFFRFRDATGAAILPESRIVSRRIAPTPPHVAKVPGLAAPTVLHMVRHRMWDGAPRLIEDIYLPLSRFELLVSAAPDAIGPLLYPAYERLCGQIVFTIEEDIAIAPSTEEDAAQLGLAPGDLVVRIERTARDATGVPMEWRVSRAEARRFRYRLAQGAEALSKP